MSKTCRMSGLAPPSATAAVFGKVWATNSPMSLVLPAPASPCKTATGHRSLHTMRAGTYYHLNDDNGSSKTMRTATVLIPSVAFSATSADRRVWPAQFFLVTPFPRATPAIAVAASATSATNTSSALVKLVVTVPSGDVCFIPLQTSTATQCWQSAPSRAASLT